MTERLHFHFSLSCIGEGNGNPLQCSCLENPRDGGAWWAAVYGVTQSRTRLKPLSSSSSSSPGRRGYDGEDCSGRSALTVHRVGGRQETDEPTDDADPGEAVGRGRGAIKRPERSMKEHRP